MINCVYVVSTPKTYSAHTPDSPFMWFGCDLICTNLGRNFNCFVEVVGVHTEASRFLKSLITLGFLLAISGLFSHVASA